MRTKVVHSESKPAWNVIGVKPGGHYKFCRVPYVESACEQSSILEKANALKRAMFISRKFNYASDLEWGNVR